MVFAFFPFLKEGKKEKEVGGGGDREGNREGQAEGEEEEATETLWPTKSKIFSLALHRKSLLTPVLKC